MLSCPRRKESFLRITKPETDYWKENNTCSYCGSLNPDKVMELIEANQVEVGPTNMNHKIYLRGPGLQEGQATVYFQHFNDEQQKRLIELLNKKTAKIDSPGYFYTLPYFVEKKPKTKEQ